MFGIFKTKWRPVVMLGVEVGEVKVGTDTDALMETFEEVIHVLQRRIEVLNQASDARYKDVTRHERILAALSSDALARRDAVIGMATKAEKNKKKVVKTPAPKKTTKKKKV